MLILGFNGGTNLVDQDIFDLDVGHSHDSAAVLLDDGKVVAWSSRLVALAPHARERISTARPGGREDVEDSETQFELRGVRC
jgi:hypothetical protein